MARFLLARACRLVFCYLSSIRPFAATLHRERAEAGYGPAPGTLLFDSYSEAESPKAWPSAPLRGVIETATSRIWVYAVNILFYRQLTIGVTDRHIQDVHQPFNPFNDQGPNAAPNVL